MRSFFGNNLLPRVFLKSMEHFWENLESIDDVLRDLINNEAFSDLQFKFDDGKIIYAHSFLLLIRSAKFYQELNVIKNKPKLIQINEVTYEIFLQLIEYIYTHQLKLTIKNVFEFYKLSRLYCLVDLKNQCTKYLLKKLTDETACDFLQSAITGKFEDLINIFRNFIAENFSPVLIADSFLEINDETLTSIISLDRVSDIN